MTNKRAFLARMIYDDLVFCDGTLVQSVETIKGHLVNELGRIDEEETNNALMLLWKSDIIFFIDDKDNVVDKNEKEAFVVYIGLVR